MRCANAARTRARRIKSPMPGRRSPEPVTLDDDDIEAVAARVVDLLRSEHACARGPRPGRRRDARAPLEVDRDWVYANARRLGAVRLGDGPKARLRFDATRARAALAAPSASTSLPRTSRHARHAGALAGDRAGGRAAHPGEG